MRLRPMHGFSHGERHLQPARPALADGRARLAQTLAADAGLNTVAAFGNDLTFD